MRFDEDHRACARRHAMNRAWQRFGVILREPELLEMAEKAKSGDLETAGLKGQSPTFIVSLMGKTARGVYNEVFGEFVTFIPPVKKAA